MNDQYTRNTLTLEMRDRGVVVLWMDDPNAALNTLNRELATEFERVLDELEGMSSLQGLVFASGKPDSFMVGANLEMLQKVTTAAEAQALSELSQQVQNRLAALPVPKVAAIHGPALGGGLELTLAFDGRVASIDPRTKLGLPEVKLGLLPGGGGTQRLPRLIGIRAALNLLLSGGQLNAHSAWEIGLVDVIVPHNILLDTAVNYALALRVRPRPRRRLSAREKFLEWLLEGNLLSRPLLFRQVRKQTLEKTRGHYPAPERILEVVRIGLERGLEAGYRAEAKGFGELVVSKEAAELINIFFAMAALKNDTGVDDPQVQAKPVNKVGVLGGGLMGAGITYITAALAETPVLLKDKDAAGAGRGLAYIRNILDQRVKRRRMSDLRRTQALTRLTLTIDYDRFADADVVIEAVFEDPQLKCRMVRDIEAISKKDTIFASNTSAIPISQIAEASLHPETVIGMHYFSPVEKMPLLEVITTAKTAPWVTATCVELGKKQGKTVIVVNDGPGFYTSRILTPYLNEAGYLVSEGVPIEAIDAALKSFGFPVGPITLLDGVGIDVGKQVAHTLHQALGERMRPPPAMEKLLADRRLGCKNRRGFYLYDGRRSGKRVDRSVYGIIGVEPRAAVPRAAELIDRCILPMVNEAAHCFQEGILHRARDGDIGAVFGLGFPPFRGGPFRYMDALGAQEVVARLEQYTRRYGERFTPAAVLVELARSGARFYGERTVTPGAWARA